VIFLPSRLVPAKANWPTPWMVRAPNTCPDVFWVVTVRDTGAPGSLWLPWRSLAVPT